MHVDQDLARLAEVSEYKSVGFVEISCMFVMQIDLFLGNLTIPQSLMRLNDREMSCSSASQSKNKQHA